MAPRWLQVQTPDTETPNRTLEPPSLIPKPQGSYVIISHDLKALMLWDPITAYKKPSLPATILEQRKTTHHALRLGLQSCRVLGALGIRVLGFWGFGN